MKFENDIDWFETMNFDASKRRRYFQAFMKQIEENELNTQLSRAIGCKLFDHKIKLSPDPEDKRYVVILPTKSIDGRAYTYAIIDLSTGANEESFCQFENYTDLLINLSIHIKIGKEEEHAMQAVNLILIGAKRSKDGNGN